MAIYVLIAHCHWLMLIDALILITSWRSCPSGNVPVQRWRFQGARRRPPVIVNPFQLSTHSNRLQWNECKSLSRPIIPSPPPISPPPPSYLPPSPPPPSHLPPSHPSLSSPPHNPPLLTSPLLLFSPYMLLLLIYRVVLRYHLADPQFSWG